MSTPYEQKIVALFRHTRYGYNTIEEKSDWPGIDDRVMVSHPVVVNFLLLPEYENDKDFEKFDEHWDNMA